MHKNYNKFNLLSLLAILAGVFLLVFLFEDSESEIIFSDPGLEAAVGETIGKEEGTLIRKDVTTLQVLDASNRQIENLEGIEHLMELRELNLENNFVKSVTPLKSTTRLESLNLRNNEITSLEAIDFEDILYLNIRKLSLWHNVERDEDGKGTRLSDLSLLRQMASLRKLDLSDNHIENLSPLSDLRRLTELDIREKKFNTIEPLETLTRLKELNLRENEIHSLEPIKYLSRLTYLNIHSNSHLESLEPIKNLVNLETLIIRNVEVKNHSFLRNLTKLQRFNAIDTGIEKLDPMVFEELLIKGALQGDVRPISILHTLEAPIISQESGFYNEGFQLEIENKVEDAEIYYTLDGSEPTMNSDIYKEPILIESMDDNSAAIVRAKVLKENNTLSETITKTYFVNEAIDERFDLPIFSLVTDPDNLFDEEIGIYKNYEGRGSEWERPVYIEYIENHYNVDKNELIILENNAELYRGRNQDAYHYYNMIQYIEENDMTQSKHLDYIETQMDFNNFIDYFATHIYYADTDWPQNNIQYWRKTTDEYIENAHNGHDGRWRWMMIDTDHGFHHLGTEWGHLNQKRDEKHNTIKQVTTEYGGKDGDVIWSNFLFRELMMNNQFKNKFLTRFNDIANGYLNEFAVNKEIEKKVNEINREITWQIDKWNAIESLDDWYLAIENKYLFAKERSYYIRKHIIEEFDLDGTVEITLSNETDQGYVRLNRMDITEELPGNPGGSEWSGIYFKGIPIEVEAIPKEGYKFSHWENINSTDFTIKFTPDSDQTFKAVFIEK